MAMKTKEGKDLLLLSLKLGWRGQTGLYMTFAPGSVGLTCGRAHVDELIEELTRIRGTMETIDRSGKTEARNWRDDDGL